MNKRARPDPQPKPPRTSKLTSLVYSTAGIGLVALAVQVLAAEPKMPRYLGE